MKRHSVRPIPPPARSPRPDVEALALRIHQIAAVAGALAAGQTAPLSHALHLVEECLLEVEARVEEFRQT